MRSRPVRLAATAGVCAIVFGLAACSDDPDPEEATEEVPVSESTPAEEAGADGELPVKSTLVNVGTGGCLRAFPDTIPPNTIVEDCQDDSEMDSGMRSIPFPPPMTAPARSATSDQYDEDSGLNGCIEWDARGAVHFETECSTILVGI